MTKRVLVLNLFLWFVSFASAQTLSLKSVLEQGLTESKTLKTNQAKIQIALAKYEQFKSALYPQVKLTAGYKRLSPIDPFQVQFPGSPEPVTLFPVILNQFDSKLSLNQVIYAGGRARFAEQSAKLLADATILDTDKDRNEIALNLVTVFFNLYKLDITNQQILESKNLSIERLREAKNMQQQGTLLYNDILKIELQLANIEQLILELNNNKALTAYNLGLQLNQSGLEKGYLLDTIGLFLPHQLGTLDTYIDAALSNRKELQANNLRINMQENNLKSTKGNTLPVVSVGATYVLANPNQRIIPNTADFKGTWDVGVNASWDITSLFINKHNIAEAQNTLTATQLGSEQLQDAIKAEVVAAYFAYQTAMGKITLYQKNITQASENQRVLYNKFTQEATLLSDLLEADVALTQAKINYQTARSDAEIAYWKLLKTIGQITAP